MAFQTWTAAKASKNASYSDKVAMRRTAHSSDPEPPKRVICPACNGSGMKDNGSPRYRIRCHECNGAGEVFA